MGNEPDTAEPGVGGPGPEEGGGAGVGPAPACVRLEKLALLWSDWVPNGRGSKMKAPHTRECSENSRAVQKLVVVSPNMILKAEQMWSVLFDGKHQSQWNEAKVVLQSAQSGAGNFMCKKCHSALYKCIQKFRRKRSHTANKDVSWNRDRRMTRSAGWDRDRRMKRSAGSPASKPKPEPEEVQICKLEWPGPAGNLLADTPPPPSPRPSTARGKRLAPRADAPAAKRPKAAPGAAQQAEALEELRRDLRESELKEQNEVLLAKVDGLAAKSAQQERLIAHLEQFNAQVLEENEELRRLLANGTVVA